MLCRHQQKREKRAARDDLRAAFAWVWFDELGVSLPSVLYLLTETTDSTAVIASVLNRTVETHVKNKPSHAGERLPPVPLETFGAQ